MSSLINNRGSVLNYSGSLSEYVGLPVIGLDDCDCMGCFQLDPWSEARRANVTLMAANAGLIKLTHVRHASLMAPAEAGPILADAA